MAEISRVWAGRIADGDAGDAGPYTEVQMGEIWRSLHSPLIATQGVFKGQLNELSASFALPQTLTINSGHALVDGTWYENTANITDAIGAPIFNPRIDRIVLRKSFAAQTVRYTRIVGAEGVAPVPPALVQNPGVTWDLPLWQLYCTVAPLYTIWRDERTFIAQYEPVGLLPTEGYFEEEFSRRQDAPFGGKHFLVVNVNDALQNIYFDGVGELEWVADAAGNRYMFIYNGPYNPFNYRAHLWYRARSTHTHANIFLRLGFFNTNPTDVAPDPAEGIYFRANGAGNWFAVTRTGAVETATDTTIAQNANYRRFDIYVVAGYGSSPVVVFLIDGVLRATHSTNIPTGTMGLYFGESHAGVPVNQAYLGMDWVKLRGLRT